MNLRGGRGLGPRLLLAVGALVVVLAMGEFVLRRFFPYHARVVSAHPRYHLVLRPSAQKVFRHREANGGASHMVRINRHGFRGDDLVEPPRHPRLVVFGDSFIHGEFSPRPLTFCERLEDHLEDHGRTHEVVNAGVASYGPDQALLRMEEEWEELQADAAILAIYAGNDYGDLIRNKLFRQAADGSVHRAAAELVPWLRWSMNPNRWRNRSLLYRSVQAWREGAGEQTFQLPTMNDFLDSCEQEYDSYLADNVVTNLFRDHYDADLAIQPECDSARAKVAILGQVLQELAQFSSQADLRVLVLVIPSAIDVCDDYEIQVDPTLCPDYQRDRLTRTATELALAAGLEVLDLFAEFRSGDPCQLYFPERDNHWNDAGQDFAAQIVAAHWAKR